jgi:hypothetical protein
VKDTLDIKPLKKRILNICDEKENPSKKKSIQTFSSIGIQCSKLDEDFIMGSEDSQTFDYYWKIMSFKRHVALKNIKKENEELSEIIDQLNTENESLREENKDLLELLDEAKSIKVCWVLLNNCFLYYFFYIYFKDLLNNCDRDCAQSE